jgi:tetratricopeptide (TPR) repeat protein
MLRSATYYDLSQADGHEKIYRRLTGQPAIIKPGLGKIKKLPPFERKQSSPPQDSKPWNVPYPRNIWFTGRGQLLTDLRAALTGEGKAALSQTQAISGMGGVGKTQTAVEYAYKHRSDYSAVFWTLADTDVALSAGFLEIARLLDLPEKDAKDLAEAREAVKRWLGANDGWLLIFDNADAPELIEPFLPPDRKGHVLLTSRASVFDTVGIANALELAKMEPGEATQFLFKRTSRTDDDLKEQKAAEDLARELDYLPLALEQAAAYIIAKKSRFEDYLSSFRSGGLKVVERYKPVAGKYPKSVLTTWALNFAEVEKTPAAAELLRLSAFLAPDDIPLELITRGASELGPALYEALAKFQKDPLVLDEVLELLTRYSLVRRNIPNRTYSIHRLVQAVVRDGMEEKTQRATAERAVRGVNQTFPIPEFENWAECERLLPHALACAGLIDKDSMEFPEGARLLNRAGYYLDARADYRGAEPLLQRALAIREKVLGPEDPDVAESLNNLGELHRTLGRSREAEPLHKRALAIWEKALGPEHPAVAASLNNLALLYAAQRRYGEAESLHQRALAIDEKALGTDHPGVALDLNNLAWLYKTQGRYGEAELLYQRSLAIREKALDPEHPDVAQSLNNLGELFRTLGRYTEAEPLHRRSRAIVEKVLGPEHPNVAVCLNNLALNYTSEGRYGEAEPMYRRALAIWEKALGPQHPDVAKARENYAALLRAMGEKK